MKTSLLCFALPCLAVFACGGSHSNDSPAPAPKTVNYVSAETELGTVIVNGVDMPRIAVPAADADDDQAAVGFIAKMGSRKQPFDNMVDYRSQQYADAVFNASGAAPQGSTSAQDILSGNFAINNSNNEPIIIGDVAYFRPGLGGTMASPAQIYLAAQHFNYVVLLYTNTTVTDADWPTQLRRVGPEGVEDMVEQVCSGPCVDGQPQTPSATKGYIKPAQPFNNIYAIGSSHGTLITYLQQSDVTLTELEALRKAFKGEADLAFNPNKVNFAFNPFDFSTNPRRIVFAHSQGTPDSVLTNKRLADAGMQPFALIAGEGGASLGCRIGGETLANGQPGDWTQQAQQAKGSGAGKQGYDAFQALIPETAFTNMQSVLKMNVASTDKGESLEKGIEGELDDRIEYGFAAAIQTGPAAVSATEAQKTDVRDSYWKFGQENDWQGMSGIQHPNDGLVNAESATRGKQSVTFYLTDHMGIIENPKFMFLELQYIQSHLPAGWSSTGSN